MQYNRKVNFIKRLVNLSCISGALTSVYFLLVEWGKAQCTDIATLMAPLYQPQRQTSMEQWSGEKQSVREEAVPVPLCPQHIPHPQTEPGPSQQEASE
jgi:hypothetical protein